MSRKSTKIVSFVPSAIEILYEIGAARMVVGVIVNIAIQKQLNQIQEKNYSSLDPTIINLPLVG